MTIKHKYPPPRIDDVLTNFKEYNSFSKSNSDWAIINHGTEKSMLLETTFRTRHGHYKILVKSFELTIAPVAFISLMNRVFRPYVDQIVIVFIDDILVYSNSMKKYVYHLRTFLQTLRECQPYAKTL